MKQYHDLLQLILDKGVEKSDRTGTGTRSLFGHQMRFDLQEGFPLITTKKVHWKSVVHELLWFIAGDTNIAYLKRNGVRIWDEWADENGDLGPVYGAQWRSWPAPLKVRDESQITQGLAHHGLGIYEELEIDQIAGVIDSLRNNPDSRRHIVSAWNPIDVEAMALPPCHCLFQFNSRPATMAERYSEFGNRQGGCDFEIEGNEGLVQVMCDEADIPQRMLDCQLYQRSADVFLGVPFNIASYALLTHMVAHVTDHIAGDFVHSFGDVHIYSNHVDQVREQLSRDFKIQPRVTLAPSIGEIEHFRFDHIFLDGYDPHPAIKAQVAV